MARWTGQPPEKKPTHCIHGHEFTEENTWTHVNKKGSTVRECRVCRRWSVKKLRLYGRQGSKNLDLERWRVHAGSSRTETET